MQKVGKRLAIQVMLANFHSTEARSDNRQPRNYRQLVFFFFKHVCDSFLFIKMNKMNVFLMVCVLCGATGP